MHLYIYIYIFARASCGCGQARVMFMCICIFYTYIHFACMCTHIFTHVCIYIYWIHTYFIYTHIYFIYTYIYIFGSLQTSKLLRLKSQLLSHDNFSKVSSIVILHSPLRSELTFDNNGKQATGPRTSAQ